MLPAGADGTRVTVILPSFAGGGAQRVMLNLLSGLGSRFERSLIVFDASGPLAAAVPDGIATVSLGRPRLRGAFVPLLRALARGRPDVIVSTIGHANLAVLAMRGLLPGHPRIIVRESNTPSGSLPALAYGRVIGLGYRWLYPTADVVICQSSRIGYELEHRYRVPGSRLCYLANPIDIAAVRAGATPLARAAGAGQRFVAAGRLTRQKGFDALIELFADLARTAHLVILGDGPERAALERQVAALGLSARVALPGFTAAPWPQYAGADAFLLSSRWEGMPNAALEALACGTPVIATAEAGGLPDVAAEAAPGAVTLAPMGAAFLGAMRAVAAQETGAVRPCLLPPRYDIPVVAERFAALIAG